LPQEVPKKYLYHKKTKVNDRTRITRYLNLVILVKTNNETEDTEKYQIVIVSFQSIRSYNISIVNSLSEGQHYVRKRKRASRCNKLIWIIEMNNTRA